ncbi:MAG: hypothetical protein RLZZ397_164 [Pseudomonadota bacterium]|jgi:preprotein translocase subunit SecE
MSSADIQTVNAAADRVKLVGAVLLLVAGLVGFYWVPQTSAWLRWVVLLVAVAAAVGVFLWAAAGQVFQAYVRDSVREAQKVVWPTRRESLQMTLYVFAFVFVMALFLWLSDAIIEWALYDLVLGWRN